MSQNELSKGLVVAVCSSPDKGFPSYLQPWIYVDKFGISGDSHAGPLRESYHNPGTLVKNDRPVSIVSDEVREEMNERFDIHMQPGDFNEQVLVQGLGDLGAIAVGSIVSFKTGVELEVVDRAWPCINLANYNREKRLINALNIEVNKQRYSRRGLLASVRKTGYLFAGNTLQILPPVSM